VSGSSSLHHANYWWYTARAHLLHTVFEPYLRPGAGVLDVGSADGPSVAWLPQRVAVDIDMRGLRSGGVCASAEQLPFPDATFDVATAFDVVEHCRNEGLALAELRRVVKPGGVVLLSVPAYQWLWSGFDVRAGHHRRYTRRRLRKAAAAAGLREERSTYAFTATLPFFLLSRLLTKLRKASGQVVQPLPGPVERLLLALADLDRRLLQRWNLPAGSSVFYAARR
jgi:SAM-dependent methyltransferase